MACKFRDEIVGKRFLSVSGFTKLKLSKISEWGWRAGVIRAASHKDNTHKDLQILVEYDDMEWHRREWISIFKDNLFHVFMVESSLVWSERQDPFSPSHGNILWPALTFIPLVSSVDLSSQSLQPVEFVLDQELAFREPDTTQPFKEWDSKLRGVKDYPDVREATRRWMEAQDGQRILLTTPSVLVGFRVEVYRSEGTTQWYTAVICGYNEATHELTVTDDTVLEGHNEDPCLVQMRLIGDRVVESIMRGEDVGITPRRSRSSTAPMLPLVPQNVARLQKLQSLGVVNGSKQTEQTSAQAQSTRKHLRRPGAVQVIESSPSPDADKGDGEARARSLRRRREIFVSDKETRNKGRIKRIKGNGVDAPSNVASKEDLENKGKKKQRTIGLRSAKKNVLEEANNSKLRRLVEVRVEDCLRRVKDNSVVGVSVSVDVPNVVDNSELSVEEDTSKCDDDTDETPLPVTVIEKKETLDVTVEETIEDQQGGEEGEEEEEEEELQEQLIEPKSEKQVEESEEKSEQQQQPVEGEEQREEKEKDLPLTLPDDDDGPLSSSSPYNRMELAGDGSTTAALLRFPDDRSDSGVSSLRSGSCASGDERSGSRSSALSSSDEPTSQQTVGTSNNSNCSSKPADIEVIENTDNKANTLDLQDSEQQSQQQQQVRVWRDPSLLLVAEPHVRHVHSVQHQTLLMSHPPGSAPSAPPPPSAAPSPHYPPPPPLMSPHPLHLPPPASHHLYSQLPDMLWKQRYPPIPVGTHLHTAAEELLERERAYAQDRDRHDRLLRDRREQEARELEKQKEREREREKVEREKQERERQERIEREKLEKQRAAEQAVHKHFEESLRLAHQKFSQRMNTWSALSSLPPPANRNSSGGTGEVDVTPQNQQRLLNVERGDRLRQDRDRAYYTQSQTQSRPQSVGSKVEYPPPPAHSRVVGVKPQQSASSPAGHTNLPKAEPNFNLFGYPAYQAPLGFLPHDPNKIKGDVKISQLAQPSAPGATSISSLIVTKNSSVDREREMGLPNPPPLMSDLKNSVIVKNEGKPVVVENVKPTMLTHSQSPKLRVSEPHYLPPAPSNNSQLKTSPFEYRSPSQSPHPLTHHHSPSPHPQYEAQNLASISKVHSVPTVHHRARQSPHPPHRQSPHPPHRQSPHQPSLTQRQSPLHQHRQSPHAHVSSPDQRYAPSAASLVYSKPATVGSYPYPSPAPPPPPPLHYAPTVTTPPKPKVSSPAPPHIYGKPTSGITAGTPVCRAQELRVSPLPLTSKAPLTPSPYQQLPQHQPPPPPHQVQTSVAPPPAHSSRSSVGIYDPRLYPPPGPGLAVSVKPPPSSPPSRSSPLHLNPGPNLAVTPAFQTQPLDLGVSSATKEEQDRPPSPKRKIDDMVCLEIKKRRIEEPVLSRVSEPSPLLASAATTITTVVNTAITEGLDRPKSASTPGTPAPPACPSPNTPAKPPSGIDSEKSNSPGPPPRPSSYPVHKLKKAWLQRHSGEDGTDDKDVVGSGSCVTLPLTLPANTVKKEGESASAVTSLHNIGSMAINSISKSKPKVNRKSNKDPPLLNGHTSSKLHDADDSSSSDPERKASPPKRIPPKVKRKKGGRKTVTDENKRKKLSASSTDSDKESGSEKESDSGKKVSGGQNDKSSKDNAKKRGRRPKTTQPALPKNEGGEEPRQKKPRDEPPTPPQRDPFAKPPVGQLKKSGESFLQDGPCFEVAPKLAKCRECRWTPNQRSRNMPNIFCRFYAFRRLRYTKNGQLAIAGFSDPHRDASQDDLKLWLPMPDNPPADLDLDMSRFLLTQVGDQFCDLLEQEKEAISVHMSDDKTIAWKRVVQGVREMCDVCETTLFNFHWACGKCGFVVCIDCYKGRKNGTIKMWGEPGRDRDDLSWLLCTNRQPHEQDRLMLTQIIAGDSLLTLGRRVHEARATWGIPMHCGCPLASQVKPTNGICKDLLKNLQCINEPINGQLKIDNDEKDSGTGEKKTDDNNSTLSWLADVALSNEDKKPEESGSSSDSDEDRDGNYSTLRELLIRPAHKSNGSRAPSPGNNSNGSNGGGVVVCAAAKGTSNKKSHLDTLDEVISSVIEHSVQKECPEVPGKPPMQLKHFVRRYNWAQKGREPLPIRIMTLTESKMLYPDVPHAWLCDGKLLRLMDPNNSGNYRIFQDQWKRGQPVIVSDVTKHLNMSLWHPDSFARDFGETKNDLINCMTGNLVPNQPMRRFWEGFENFSKRLKDERGNHMLLKLKDWPPGEDFAEMLPSRFNDLMKVLPLGEYSQRSGRLNLASRLPDCFVRPDLGPKMYTAYGSALYATKGTTNLHLDISDAVNVMVYVGIPKDGDNEEHIKEAFRAIDEAGCDILTRRRVREKGELPGALWHIYTARDADKIRDLLNKVALERGARLEPHHDPIHDQSWYLDGPLRERLYKEYAVEGYAIVQCLGDAVFIPAGAPHQVRNLHNCIKVAEDFVSPENVSHCFHLTQEFRELSDTHSNHEDKLQIKNIIYHAVKDALSALGVAKESVTVTDIEQEMPIKQEDITDS